MSLEALWLYRVVRNVMYMLIPRIKEGKLHNMLAFKIKNFNFWKKYSRFKKSQKSVFVSLNLIFKGIFMKFGMDIKNKFLYQMAYTKINFNYFLYIKFLAKFKCLFNYFLTFKLVRKCFFNVKLYYEKTNLVLITLKF